MRLARLTIVLVPVAALIALAFVFASGQKVDFNTQIRPILNKNCLGCHGGVRQRSNLSFLFPEEALLPAESGKRAIVPGDPQASEMIRRINHFDPQERMPPESDPLSEQDKKLLARWIKQGAQWDTHWAYRPIVAPSVEPAPPGSWGENAIDRFVLEKLEQHNLKPSAEAARSTLARRLSLDLVGLPPDPEMAQAFLVDERPDAYERYVDALLASPHFGERWASVWLDLARYADSQGYQKDLLRTEVWRYRDWVIDAFNQDMPFDQFTIEQLAGDLLPEPSESQLLATTFHRNTMTNDEGGTDDEEFRVSAVIDRLNTTFEIWQGTTIGCVQCHHHPYDPIRHQEYYQLSAFFNTTADRDYADDRPLALLYSPAQLREKASIEEWLDLRSQKGDTVSSAYRDKLKAFLAIQPGLVPVMKELPVDSTRKQHVFVKGNWLVHGPEVQPDVPGFLPPLLPLSPRNRLGLAEWLTDERNPLTARVTVNRFWEKLFGQGLVSTLEDFGTQGRTPTHPELLDWLAREFVTEHQWSVKALLKQIVLSATYKQSSAVTPELLRVDARNQFLARAPRYRLSAEQIRDQALSISGLLNPGIYGKSVMPYQPAGVWNVIRHAARWEMGSEDDRHRRALYTFWRRVSPYPSMMTFDAPSRELCVSRRIRTNTPLQALVTLNDPVFFEAAEALATRMQTEGGESVSEKIRYGFRLALVREPDEQRLKALMGFYESVFESYQDDQTAKDLLFTGDGDQTDSNVENAEIDRSTVRAALINVANVILNLDELIMRS
jgi:hypothetical protein